MQETVEEPTELQKATALLRQATHYQAAGQSPRAMACVIDAMHRIIADRVGDSVPDQIETRCEVPVSAKKRMAIYTAISAPIVNERVRISDKTNLSQQEVDEIFRRLTESIWTKVKIELGLRD